MNKDVVALEVLKVLLMDTLQSDRNNDVLISGMGLERDWVKTGESLRKRADEITEGFLSVEQESR